MATAVAVATASDQDYCEFTLKHTLCRFKGGGTGGPACGGIQDRSLSEKEAQEVVDYHNRYEFKVLILELSLKMLSLKKLLLNENQRIF